MNKTIRAVSFFVVALAGVLLVGFLGYRVGFLEFIYRVMMVESHQLPLLVLALFSAVAAFFSPCTITVLPSYVAHFLAKKREFRNGLSLGLTAAAGVVTINLLLGLVIAILGAAAPFAKDPRQDIPLILTIRAMAGATIALLGIFTFRDKGFDIPLFGKMAEMVPTEKSMFLYGLLYNGAAIGCTGPILLGLTLYAITMGSFASAFGAFLVFALTMGILMVLMTTSISLVGDTLVRKILPLTPLIRKTAGIVMVATGATIALLTLEGNNVFVKLFFPFLQ